MKRYLTEEVTECMMCPHHDLEWGFCHATNKTPEPDNEDWIEKNCPLPDSQPITYSQEEILEIAKKAFEAGENYEASFYEEDEWGDPWKRVSSSSPEDRADGFTTSMVDNFEQWAAKNLKL